jgi:exodeoxyribonuclease-3
MVTQSRKKNVGWRIDYFFAAREVIDRITDAFILPDVMGSDHCPVGIKLKL